jgi:hypothetical protein
VPLLLLLLILFQCQRNEDEATMVRYYCSPEYQRQCEVKSAKQFAPITFPADDLWVALGMPDTTQIPARRFAAGRNWCVMVDSIRRDIVFASPRTANANEWIRFNLSKKDAK